MLIAKAVIKPDISDPRQTQVPHIYPRFPPFYTNPQVKWHDVACYHRKHVLCEDSDTLLDYVRATNEGIKL